MSKRVRWHADLSGEDGNAFVILGVVSKALKLQGHPPEVRDAVIKRLTTGDYDSLLRKARQYVDIVDHPTGVLEVIEE